MKSSSLRLAQGAGRHRCSRCRETDAVRLGKLAGFLPVVSGCRPPGIWARHPGLQLQAKTTAGLSVQQLQATHKPRPASHGNQACSCRLFAEHAALQVIGHVSSCRPPAAVGHAGVGTSAAGNLKQSLPALKSLGAVSLPAPAAQKAPPASLAGSLSGCRSPEELPASHKLHDKVDAVLILEAAAHPHNEREVHDFEDVALSLQVRNLQHRCAMSLWTALNRGDSRLGLP